MITGVHAGGATLLHLPIEGVTGENRDQCARLFMQKFGPILIDSKYGAAVMIKDGPTDLVVLRPDHGQISLREVERALEGSAFSIHREQLEYFSLLRLRIGKTADSEKHVKALASLDGKTLQSHSVENADGSIWITLRDPTRNTAMHLAEKRKRSLVTHQRLTRYLVENKIELIEISWGFRHHLDHDTSWRDGAGTRPEIWRGDSFGARSAPEVLLDADIQAAISNKYLIVSADVREADIVLRETRSESAVYQIGIRSVLLGAAPKTLNRIRHYSSQGRLLCQKGEKRLFIISPRRPPRYGYIKSELLEENELAARDARPFRPRAALSV